jgi:RHS repeat-associated protein
MALTDMNEAVAVSYRYDPYGAVTITRNGTPQANDPLGNPWTFTARQLDEETGLYVHPPRAYDPATGRSMQFGDLLKREWVTEGRARVECPRS